MCIAFLLLNVHPSVPIIVVNNRDEFAERLTGELETDEEWSTICVKDLEEGGTWMGCSFSASGGCIAMLTNYRGPISAEQLASRGQGLSRGFLVRDTLRHTKLSTETLEAYRPFLMTVLRLREVPTSVDENHREGDMSKRNVAIAFEYLTNEPSARVERTQYVDGAVKLHVQCNTNLENTTWPKIPYLRDRINSTIVPMFKSGELPTVDTIREACAKIMCETPCFLPSDLPAELLDSNITPTAAVEPLLQANVFTDGQLRGRTFRTVSQSVLIVTDPGYKKVVKEADLSLSGCYNEYEIVYNYRTCQSCTDHSEWTTVKKPFCVTTL